MKQKLIYKKRYNKKKWEPRTRINYWIKTSPIRLIDENNKNVGIVETPKAIKMAQEKGLDLIEISPNAKPPVCRIMDNGKYKYEKSRKERDQKTKQKRVETKGIRISPRIGQHDLEFKVKQAEKFLEKGHKVKIEMILKGREKWLPGAAEEKINKFLELISIEIIFEQGIKRQPRGLIAIITKGQKNEKT